MLKRGTAIDPRVHALHTVILMNEFPDVTRKGLGLLKGMKVEVGLKEGAAPKFCKSRPIHFALRERVKQVMQKQVEDGEMEPVEKSDWAAPIMVVKIKDGGLRVCANFRVTINPYLKMKTYPLPTRHSHMESHFQNWIWQELTSKWRSKKGVDPSSPSTHLGAFSSIAICHLE